MDPLKPALAVFIKAPEPGQCKTRLCPPLSFEQAAELYRHFCRDVMETAQTVNANLWIAYDPSPLHPTPQWAANCPYFFQTGSNLGERLIHAFNTLFTYSFRPVVIIGSDAPLLTAEILTTAFTTLEREEVVIGPALDGGYYLVGLTNPHPELFRGIPWSTGEVLNATRVILKKKGLRTALLQTESDTDTPEDVRSLLQTLGPHLPARCRHTQAALIKLKSLLTNSSNGDI